MDRPKHLFVTSDGGLYDTRVVEWSKHPLRADYAKGFARIANTAQLRATLRNGQYAWPGGYPLFFITSDGGALSFESVRKNLRNVLDSIAHKSADGWRVVACEVNWEDSDLTCDDSGKRIESAYGNDSDESND
jgi:hypothetical protein